MLLTFSRNGALTPVLLVMRVLIRPLQGKQRHDAGCRSNMKAQKSVSIELQPNFPLPSETNAENDEAVGAAFGCEAIIRSGFRSFRQNGIGLSKRHDVHISQT